VPEGRIPPVNDRIRAAAERLTDDRGRQARLAKDLSVSRNAVSGWFAGRSTPEKQHWPAIAAELGLVEGELESLAAEYYSPGITRLVDTLRRNLAAAEEDLARLRGGDATPSGGQRRADPPTTAPATPTKRTSRRAR
jgi:transcriptional regulator with XRE-family HTH domain